MQPSIYDRVKKKFSRRPERFWRHFSRDFVWEKPYLELYRACPNGVGKWFVGGRLDYSANILDLKVKKGLGDKEALSVYKKTGRIERYTYTRLLEKVSALAWFLDKKGIKKGARVLILFSREDKEESLLIALTLQRIGAIFSFLYAGFPEHMLDYFIRHTKARYLIYDRKLGCRFKKTQGLLIIYKEQLAGGGKNKGIFPGGFYRSDEPSFYIFTSGTTAAPKIILSGNPGSYLSPYTFQKLLLGMNAESVFLNTLNFAFTPTFIFCYGALMLESRLVLYEDHSFYGPGFNSLIKREGIDKILAVPSFLEQVNNKISAKLTIGLTGEKVNKQHADRLRKYFTSAKVFNMYGATETMGCFSTPEISAGAARLSKLSLLQVFPGVRCVIAQADTNGVGPLWLKNALPSLCFGYVNDQGAFLKRFRKNFKYFDTSDLARKTANGLEIVGRSDMLIKIKGRYLQPGLMETQIMGIKGIPTAKVLSMDNNIYVFVEARGNARLKGKIFARINDKIGAYARPKEIFFLKPFPRTGSGKIAESALWKLINGF